MRKIATLDIPGVEIKCIREALGILAEDDIAYELVPAGQDIRVASIVLLSGDSPRAKALWIRLRKWAPVGSVAGLVFGDRAGTKAVGADRCMKRPITVEGLVSELRLLHQRNRNRTVSELRDDAASPISINRSAQTDAPTGDERLVLGGNVLVVDDSVTVRRQLKFALSRFGLNVDTADCGEDGLKHIIERHYDLLFLDVVMPGTDGFRICRKIKDSRDFRDLPIIMLTSKSSPFDKVRGALSGCDSYLTKPVDLGVLQEILKRHLSGSVHAEILDDGHAATAVIESLDVEGAKA